MGLIFFVDTHGCLNKSDFYSLTWNQDKFNKRYVTFENMIELSVICIVLRFNWITTKRKSRMEQRRFIIRFLIPTLYSYLEKYKQCKKVEVKILKCSLNLALHRLKGWVRGVSHHTPRGLTFQIQRPLKFGLIT